MRVSIHSLHTRLALGLLGLLLVLAVINVSWTLFTNRLHEEEVTQSLQRDLAHHIVAMKRDLLVDPEGEVRSEALGEIFHWLMVVNPGVEFYVLDRHGELLAFDAPPGKIRRHRVALEPIQRFLVADRRDLPIRGDDPRHESRRKVFSVAPLAAQEGGEPIGYLYIILASEQVDSVGSRLRSSYLLRLSLLVATVSFLVTLLAGTVLLRRLTLPLRRLASRMASFQIPGGPAPRSIDELPDQEEILLLEDRFAAMAERIERQVDKIREIEESRRELIAAVSHDLRTPIAGVRGYLETVLLKEESLPPAERHDYLTIALRQAERLAHLVDELFELTKLEARETQLRLETFSLSELVQDNVQRYRLDAENRGIRLEGKLSPEVPLVRADIGLLERVLQNLLENALRFTPREGRIEVSVAEEEGEVVVRVRDTGRGIPSDELSRIFDRFYRGERETDGSGAGLGLAIARRIIEFHGARLEVESREGEGSCFSFALPPVAA